MRLWIDIRVGHKHHTVGPNEVGDALGQRDESAGRSDRLRQVAVAIAEKAERKGVLLGELPVLFRAVVGNTEHLDSEFLEFIPAVPQPVRFQRSTRGAGLWIEEQQERATFEISPRHRGAIMGLEFKIDEWLSDGNHVSSSGVSDGDEHRQLRQRDQ